MFLQGSLRDAIFVGFTRKLISLLLLSAQFGVAQAPPYTGLPPFGTFNRDAIDTINVGNLNVHFQFPLFVKKGRG
jgi:hypothetical protein